MRLSPQLLAHCCSRPTALVNRLKQLVVTPAPSLHAPGWPAAPSPVPRAVSSVVAAGNAASRGGPSASSAAAAASSRAHRTTRSRSQAVGAAEQPQQVQQGTGSSSTRRGRSKARTVQQLQAAAAGTPQQLIESTGAAAVAQTAGAAAAAVRARRIKTSSSGGSDGGTGRQATTSSRSGRSSPTAGRTGVVLGPHVATTSHPLPHVLILHTGGTLGMDAAQSFEVDPHELPHQPPVLKRGTGGIYGGLEPGQMLSNIFQQVPELSTFANLDLQVVFNKDSSRVGPKEWVQIAKLLDKYRQSYDAFLVVHGTDTMAYTASALSLMLAGFRKPIVMTGSQLPLSSPRSDARQNLIDALTCATASFKPPHVAPLHEVAVCFGGRLMRGNRTRKVDSSKYQAFDSPGFPLLASLGVDVDWNERYLLRVEGGYVPRFKLESAVLRVPVVPGCDPRAAYGDLVDRGVRGIVLEAFGVGNFPDLPQQGWVPWLRQQTRKGLQVYLASQCHLGPLKPELYKSGALALEMGVEAGPQMTPECAVVKMMLCLAHPDIPLGQPLAGEL